MTDADVAKYVEALQSGAPHTAAAPNGGPPPAGGYANSIVPAPNGGLLQAARPYLLPTGAAAVGYYLTGGNIWWTAGLGVAAAILQGNFASPPVPPPAPPRPPWDTGS